jgi:uncharacterized protein YwgA
MNTRVAQLIRQIVERVPGCGRTRIVKLLYLADHEARRYLGRPLTDLDYRWDNFGPYDPEIQRQINCLKGEGQIQEVANLAPEGYTWYQYNPAGRGVRCELGKEEAVLFDYVIQTYSDMKLQDLLDEVVYQTRPMTAAANRGERLRMELVDGEKRIPGLELENVIRGVEQIDNGQKRSLEEVALGLQR